MSQLVPHTEAAVYLGVSRVKLWKMAKGGEIPMYPDPLDKRKRLYKRSDLDRLKQESSGKILTRGNRA